MTDCDAQWDEDRGGLPEADNLISFPSGGVFHKATEKLLPWRQCGGHDHNRHVVPSIFIEKLVRSAPVPDPPAFQPEHFMTKCLDVKYLAKALDLLIDEGLVEEEDAEGNAVPRRLADSDALYAHADKLVKELQDAPELQCSPICLEWLHGYTNASAAEAEIRWFHDLTLDRVLRAGDLQVYVQLGLAVGPRSLHPERTRAGSQFYTVVGAGGRGGMLAQAIRKYYFPGDQASQAMDPAFLVERVVPFFLDTAWPAPYEQHLEQWIEYAYDLASRASWKTASRQEWMVIVTNKIVKAIRQLPMLECVFRDQLQASAALTLARNYEALGDVVLGTTTGLPFWRIEDVEARLQKDYQEFIESEREASQHTNEILIKLHERLKVSNDDGQSRRQGEGGEDLGPKPGLLAKACATQSYTNLEIKFTAQLEASTQSVEDKMEMFKECFGARTVLPKAVLLATTGFKLSVYTGASGTDFLTLLHGQRHLLGLYLMRSLAYDQVEQEVPIHMRTLTYDEKEVKKLCDFKWAELDLLNQVVLLLRGAQAGTTYAVHPLTKMYHDGDIIRLIQTAGGKLFDSIGYPSSVTAAEGWTFRGFIEHAARFQQYAIALPAEEQKTALATLDALMPRGFDAAARSARRTVFGASPADNKLRAWISADEAVVIELKDMLDGLKGHAQYRRQTLGIFAKDAPAAMLPSLMSGSRAEKSKRLEGEAGTARKKASQGSKQKERGNGGPKDGTSRATPGGGQRKADSPRPDRRTAEGKSIYPYANGDYSIGEQPLSNLAICTNPARRSDAHKRTRAMLRAEEPRQTPRNGRRNPSVVPRRAARVASENTASCVCDGHNRQSAEQPIVGGQGA